MVLYCRMSYKQALRFSNNCNQTFCPILNFHQAIFFIFLGALKGVMRVGVLAKGLLLHERLDVDLVVLCHGKEILLNPSLK